METKKHDVVVIGAGPGGYVAAIRAAQMGYNVACIEKEPQLGGVCLRVGCIPSKALLESSERWDAAGKDFKEHGIVADNLSLDLDAMMQRKKKVVDTLTRGIGALFKKNKITRYEGSAKLAGPKSVEVTSADGSETQTLQAEKIILATGSRPVALPGIVLDGDRVGTSTEALSYTNVPKSLVVIGAGYIGLELGSVWNRLGSKVTVLEYLDRILPGMDSEIAGEAQKIFAKQGLEFRLGARVTGARTEGDHAVVEIDGQDPIECEQVLVSVGRRPNSDNLGLEAIGVDIDARGKVKVNERFSTSVEGVYAIGDLIQGPMLAHKAEEDGIACVEGFQSAAPPHVDYHLVPGVVYTHPEIGVVGYTEDALKSEGIPYKVGSFPFTANGRARALGDTVGRVKLLAHAETDRVLGAHIIGPRAGDLIAELVAAMAYGASSEDLYRVSHAHPTLCEAIKEAAMAVEGRAIHF